MEWLGTVILGSVGGLAGAFAMNGFMRAVSAKFGKKVDMTEALGSFITGRLDNAKPVGSCVHGASGIVFGIVYCLLFAAMGAAHFPYSFFVGIAFGFFHGLLVSYGLMFLVSEQHPIQRFRRVTLETGLLHLVGHIIFGGVVGLVGALLSQAFN